MSASAPRSAGLGRSVARIFAITLLLCGAVSCGPENDSLVVAQREVPFRIRAPESSALPPSVAPTPLVQISKDPVPRPASSSAPAGYLYGVAIFYEYKAAQAPEGLQSSDAVSIVEYQNPGGETRLVAEPTGGQHTSIDGRPVVVSHVQNVAGVEIVWVQDGVGFDLHSTLPWGDTVRVFRSMTASAPQTSAGTPTAASG